MNNNEEERARILKNGLLGDLLEASRLRDEVPLWLREGRIDNLVSEWQKIQQELPPEGFDALTALLNSSIRSVARTPLSPPPRSFSKTVSQRERNLYGLSISRARTLAYRRYEQQHGELKDNTFDSQYEAGLEEAEEAVRQDPKAQEFLPVMQEDVEREQTRLRELEQTTLWLIAKKAEELSSDTPRESVRLPDELSNHWQTIRAQLSDDAAQSLSELFGVVLNKLLFTPFPPCKDEPE